MDSRSEDMESGIGNRESGVGKEREVWGDGEMGRWGPTPNPSQEGNGEMGRS
ncbi:MULTISPECIES: hypothetical protein [unclassified Moorena]|uniref:hypothetical protein n=1 Tax=unclassified Moorena TaxID=2683338 RepID=UPI0013C7A567|nr:MULTISPECIES: hypothetical protein [unclassified Moorena]NEO18241.1 hypothetical protein [Moorena sp. SIO4A5]NEQ60251.1 hypothetical protein [Moorena sp. SIO4A1]